MSEPRWVIKRCGWVERWRVGVMLRVFHGFGSPRFEFEFRFGFPKAFKDPEWVDYEAVDYDGKLVEAMRAYTRPVAEDPPARRA